MRKLVIIAMLLASTSLAQALEPISGELLGSWCALKHQKDGADPWLYQREVNPIRNRIPCRGEDWMDVKPNGYEGGEYACKTIRGRYTTKEIYIANYSCNGEGSAGWKEDCRLTLNKNKTLAVSCDKKSK
jgi:hypothetical protein